MMRSTTLHRAPPHDLEILLHYLLLVIRSEGLTDWERKFCASIISRQKRGPIHPTDRQLAVMRRLVRRFRESHLRETT